MKKLTPDEQTLYYFAFRFVLSKKASDFVLVAYLVLMHMDEFEKWRLQDMIEDVEANLKGRVDITSVDVDVKRSFQQKLMDELAGRSANGK